MNEDLNISAPNAISNDFIFGQNINVYVNPQGSDKNNGSENYPFKTVQYAIDYVQALPSIGRCTKYINLQEGDYSNETNRIYSARDSGGAIQLNGNNQYLPCALCGFDNTDFILNNLSCDTVVAEHRGSVTLRNVNILCNSNKHNLYFAVSSFRQSTILFGNVNITTTRLFQSGIGVERKSHIEMDITDATISITGSSIAEAIACSCQSSCIILGSLTANNISGQLYSLFTNSILIGKNKISGNKTNAIVNSNSFAYNSVTG